MRGSIHIDCMKTEETTLITGSSSRNGEALARRYLAASTGVAICGFGAARIHQVCVDFESERDLACRALVLARASNVARRSRYLIVSARAVIFMIGTVMKLTIPVFSTIESAVQTNRSR